MDAQVKLFAVLMEIAVGGFAIAVFAILLKVLKLQKPAPRQYSFDRNCHHCGSKLIEIDWDCVPLDKEAFSEVPANASHYCPNCKPIRYFGRCLTIDEALDKIKNELEGWR